MFYFQQEVNTPKQQQARPAIFYNNENCYYQTTSSPYQHYNTEQNNSGFNSSGYASASTSFYNGYNSYTASPLVNTQTAFSPVCTNNLQQVTDSSSLEEHVNSTQQDFLNESDYNSDLETSNPSKKKRVLSSSQRTAANNRERKRMTIMNDAFVDLRHKLPISTGRKRRKMARLDIVVGAMEYIAYLETLLQS